MYTVPAIARRDPCIDDKEAFPILRVRQECFKAFVILEVGDGQLNAIIIWGNLLTYTGNFETTENDKAFTSSRQRHTHCSRVCNVPNMLGICRTNYNYVLFDAPEGVE